jgi:16S rRNA G1207 methylase RsmC
LKLFRHNDLDYKFARYPKTSNRSLRAWSAAEEHVLQKIEELELSSEKIVIYNDRFGFLSCILNEHMPLVMVHRKSQQRSIEQNMNLNKLEWDRERQFSPLPELPEKVDVGIINIPKTMDLFELYLNHLSRSLSEQGMVICSFMTKYFSPQMLSIAGEYFEDVEQSLARKKSRLLILKNKTERPVKKFIHTIPFAFEGEREELQQYFGVFSSGNIDYATQFLIEHLTLKDDDKKMMDLASGNGVIARAIQLKDPEAEIHLVDDSILAVESSKLNLDLANTNFHWDDTLKDFEVNSFDLVVSNPPFHFGNETNIEVSLRLFQEVANILKPGGRFICVANRHLNYKTHLVKNFSKAKIMNQNKKYVLYECKVT